MVGACAADANPSYGTAGYWMGLWHGLISPFTLLLSIPFDVGVYQSINSGIWYDAGFVCGLALLVAVLLTLAEGDGADLLVLTVGIITIIRLLIDGIPIILGLIATLRR